MVCRLFGREVSCISNAFCILALMFGKDIFGICGWNEFVETGRGFCGWLFVSELTGFALVVCFWVRPVLDNDVFMFEVDLLTPCKTGVFVNTLSSSLKSCSLKLLPSSSFVMLSILSLLILLLLSWCQFPFEVSRIQNAVLGFRIEPKKL